MYDVIIIGSGIAGVTAAIYCKRANLDILLIEQEIAGGQINETTTIDNYPGLFGITGPELANKLDEHVNSLNINFRYDEVKSISKEDNIFKISINNQENEQLESKTIILATGAKPRRLGLENEESFIGHGISFCATCDGALAKDEIVVIVGGGNSAATEALYLSKIASKVYIVQNLNELTCNADLKEKILNNENIEVIYNAKITELHGEQKLQSVSILTEPPTFLDNQDVLIDNCNIIPTSNLFICIGREPNTELVKDLVDLTPNNYIITDDNLKSSLDGLYVAGDVRDKKLRQMITAAADGAIAANSVIDYLR